MMGVGKTTLGKQLAKLLHFSFLDLDKAIVLSEGQSIEELFAQKGDAYFRLAEQKALQTTAQRNHIVIATGGGTPCYFDNMEWMNEHGKTVYLRANAAFILSRVNLFPEKRPLLKGKSVEEIGVFVGNLLDQRAFYYEQSSISLDIPRKMAAESVKSML
jgi:shikimate kinase